METPIAEEISAPAAGLDEPLAGGDVLRLAVQRSHPTQPPDDNLQCCARFAAVASAHTRQPVDVQAYLKHLM
jgi:hypothetical protein